MMKQKAIKCPYCHANASLRPASVVYGLNRRSQGKFLYLCDRWPACDAYVRAHDRTHRPMGTLANGDLRHKRILAHRALEQLRQSRFVSCNRAGTWKNGRSTSGSRQSWGWMNGRPISASFPNGCAMRSSASAGRPQLLPPPDRRQPDGR